MNDGFIEQKEMWKDHPAIWITLIVNYKFVLNLLHCLTHHRQINISFFLVYTVWRSVDLRRTHSVNANCTYKLHTLYFLIIWLWIWWNACCFFRCQSWVSLPGNWSILYLSLETDEGIVCLQHHWTFLSSYHYNHWSGLLFFLSAGNYL